MGNHVTTAPPVNADPPSKYRVGFFSPLAADRVEQSASQVVETVSETSLTATVIVSGLPFWPSRDPIGEEGGVNVYAIVRNGPVTRLDPLGDREASEFFDRGSMIVEYGEKPRRYMRITFMMYSEFCCKCSKIDFEQTFVDENLEGPETKRYTWPPDHFLWDPDVFRMTGVVHPDHGPGTPPYFIESDGDGYYWDNDCASTMLDSPYDGPDDRGGYYETPSGTYVLRKTRASFTTVATCIEGDWEGECLGVVKWKLDYESLAPDASPNLSVVEFLDCP